VDLTPETALFVGGFVAAIVWFAAGLTYVAGGGIAAVEGLALGLALLGALVLLVGVVIAVAIRRRQR
jgi:hypothetical protein